MVPPALLQWRWGAAAGVEAFKWCWCGACDAGPPSSTASTCFLLGPVKAGFSLGSVPMSVCTARNAAPTPVPKAEREKQNGHVPPHMCNPRIQRSWRL